MSTCTGGHVSTIISLCSINMKSNLMKFLTFLLFAPALIDAASKYVGVNNLLKRIRYS